MTQKSAGNAPQTRRRLRTTLPIGQRLERQRRPAADQRPVDFQTYRPRLAYTVEREQPSERAIAVGVSPASRSLRACCSLS